MNIGFSTLFDSVVHSLVYVQHGVHLSEHDVSLSDVNDPWLQTCDGRQKGERDKARKLDRDLGHLDSHGASLLSIVC